MSVWRQFTSDVWKLLDEYQVYAHADFFPNELQIFNQWLEGLQRGRFYVKIFAQFKVCCSLEKMRLVIKSGYYSKNDFLALIFAATN